MSSALSSFFGRAWLVFTSAILFRLALLLYGRWQDANSPVKYTDIDYLVFTDASRFLAWGRSPYDRATYRYTPLLAWLLYPTSWGGLWFEFGKVLFAAGDIVTGWLVFKVLRDHHGMNTERATKYASIWLLNPMVANISTRGSSEGLLAVIVLALLWATLQKRVLLAGTLLGLAVHLKIYPFIYAASIFWWLGRRDVGDLRAERRDVDEPELFETIVAFFNPARRQLIASSVLTLMALNAVMLK